MRQLASARSRSTTLELFPSKRAGMFLVFHTFALWLIDCFQMILIGREFLVGRL